MKIIFLLLSAFLPIYSFAQLSLTKAPKNWELFPRNNQDSAMVKFEGKVTANIYDHIIIKGLKDDVEFKDIKLNLTYSNNVASFSTSIGIKAGLQNYFFQMYGVKNNVSTSLYKADSILCGDVFVITGQSNAAGFTQASGANAIKNTFVRSFETPFITM